MTDFTRRIRGLLAITGAWAMVGCTPQGLYPDPMDSGLGVLAEDPPPARDRRPGRPDRSPAVDAAPPPLPIRQPSFEPVRSEVIFLVDRSALMATPIACEVPPCETRWDLLAGFTDALDDRDDLFRWSLALYPSTDHPCGVSECVAASLTDDAHGPELGEILQRVAPSGERPLAAATLAVSAALAPQGIDPARALVVLTAGQPTCGCPPPLDPTCEQDAAERAFSRALAAHPEMDIHLIGVGIDAQETRDALDDVSRSGGAEPPVFVSDAEEVSAAVAAVLGRMTPCTYASPDPATAEHIEVFLDGLSVQPCRSAGCASGYTLHNGRTLRFGEAMCRWLRDGEPHTVQIESTL